MVTNVFRFALIATLVLAGLALGVLETTRAKTTRKKTAPPPPQAGRTYSPVKQPMMVFSPINVSEIARQEALAPSQVGPAEIKAIDPPKGDPPNHGSAPILLPPGGPSGGIPNAPPPSPTGPSPGPTRTFKGQESLVAVIPPDTMGAVGTTHIVTATNDRLRIQDRSGAVISTVTTNSFWSGLVLEGGATPSITDPRIYYDRFNNRFIFSLVANPQVLSSATLIAVTATADPTGTWFRYAIDADPTATAAGGKWADFPSMGFNKDWIVIQDNLFGYGTLGTGYQGPLIHVIDKASIYTGPLSLTTFTFQDPVSNCIGTGETILGCGFTMAPAIIEDNTSATEYMLEDWDSTAAQLRLSKITGPVGAPVLTVGTQLPQSANSWRFNATRIGTTGGYAPQKDTTLFVPSTTARMMTNDSRIGAAPVFRNGSLWATHQVMIATVPTAAGVQVGGGGVNPADNHTAVQWWQIDPTIETGLSTPATQRSRIEDPSADNCHNAQADLWQLLPVAARPLTSTARFSPSRA